MNTESKSVSKDIETVNSIFEYYIKYEEASQLINDKLPTQLKSSYRDFTFDVFGDTKEIEKYLAESKLTQIKKEVLDSTQISSARWNNYYRIQFEALIEKKSIELSAIINELLEETSKKKLLPDELEEEKGKLVQTVNSIIFNNSVTLCFPVFEYKRKVERNSYAGEYPLLISNCHFDEERELVVDESYVNFTAIKLLTSYFTSEGWESPEKLEIGAEAERTIEILISNIKEFNNKSVREIIRYVNNQLTNIAGKDINIEKLDIKSPQKVTNFSFASADKVYATTADIKTKLQSPFKKDIETIKRYYNEQQYLPTVLGKYLGITKSNNREFSLKRDKFFFHFGSYLKADDNKEQHPVNERQWCILRDMDSTDLLSVNGPPGNGKTTLLKEIISNNIINKALMINQLWDKEWVKEEYVAGKDTFCMPFGLKNQYSMVVTSTNNKAVENIAAELLKEVDYFGQIFNDEDKKYKGILCAKIGNSTNRSDFYEIYGRLYKYLSQSDSYDQDKENEIRQEFYKVYNELNNIKDNIENYLEYKKNLKEHIRSCCNFYDLRDSLDVSQLKAELANILQYHNKQITEISAAIEQAETNKNKKESKISELRKDIKNNSILSGNEEELIRKNERLQSELCDAKEKYDLYKYLKPLKYIVNSVKEYHAKYPNITYIDLKLSEATEAIGYSRKIVNELNSKNKLIEAAIGQLRSEIEKEQDILKALSNDKNELVNKLSRVEADDDMLCSIENALDNFEKEVISYLDKDEDNPENLSVYKLVNSKKILAFRQKLFVQALKIIEQYILKNSKAICENLKMAIDPEKNNSSWFENYKYGITPKDHIMALWETLFLCFPLFSTTLHSFSNENSNFCTLEKDLIDTILVDESGQVLPHYVCAPLYMTRKAVIVGDTKQLEPVNPIKEFIISVKEDTRIKIDSLKLKIESASCQSYADAHSDIYEYLNKDERIGIILDEHRRCEESIIKFCNKELYRGKMELLKKDSKVFGKDIRELEGVPKFLSTNLIAIDVRGTKRKEHVNSMEVKACRKLVESLIEIYGNAVKKEIGIITPFYKQARELATALKKYIDKEAIGTVHTFQGQEKSIIIFSSVVDDFKTQNGLFDFIGKRPNMLNVAISRAKEQFILLGNLEELSKANNFLSKFIGYIKATPGAKTFSFYDEKINNIKHTREDLLKVSGIFNGEYDSTAKDNISCYINSCYSNYLVEGAKKHYDLMLELISRAEHSICITSPWIKKYVVNESFIKLLEAKKQSGVGIMITFGYKSKTKTYNLESDTDIKELILEDDSYAKNYSDGIWEEAIYSIKSLKQKIRESLQHMGNLHAKILVVDKKYVIAGSHNWLSNNGGNDDAKNEFSLIMNSQEAIEYVMKKFFSKEQIK